MRPDEKPVPTPDPRGQVNPPARDHTSQHEAVASMTRQQIDQIYNHQAASQPGAPQQDENPYHRSHSTSHKAAASGDWQQYHSAWQKYYQKYYERYYVGAVSQAHTTYQQHAAKLQEETAKAKAAAAADEAMSEEEALYDLRSQLLNKMQTGAKKVRKSRHFIPLVSAACVLLVFVFLQYNSIIFGQVQAYVVPGKMDPQNIITDPNASVKVGPEPRLIIPKLNIDIYVNYSAKPDQASQLAAMKKGVAYFGARGFSALPGEYGNFGISGHSSNEFYDDGAAKFIFAQLERMKKGDTFYLNYKGTRYTYSVTGTKTVAPNDVKSLQIGTKKPMVTLITCTPVGTDQNRFLVFAEQVNPSPTKAKHSTNTSVESADASGGFTGKDPTLIEQLFGAR